MTSRQPVINSQPPPATSAQPSGIKHILLLLLLLTLFFLCLGKKEKKEFLLLPGSLKVNSEKRVRVIKRRSQGGAAELSTARFPALGRVVVRRSSVCRRRRICPPPRSFYKWPGRGCRCMFKAADCDPHTQRLFFALEVATAGGQSRCVEICLFLARTRPEEERLIS